MELVKFSVVLNQEAKRLKSVVWRIKKSTYVWVVAPFSAHSIPYLPKFRALRSFDLLWLFHF